MEALRENNLGHAQELLDRQLPQPGESDLRGWEWRYLWKQTRSDALSILCQKSEIESLAVSADGRWLAISLVHKGGLFVYDLQTRQQVANLAPDDTEVRTAFSPAEPLLAFSHSNLSASGERQPTLNLWNAATQRTVAEIPIGTTQVGLAFSQDGRRLATGENRGITLWSVPDGAELASYPSEGWFYAYEMTSFAATSDLGLAAYGSRGGRIRVMDLRSGKELWTAAASSLYVTALAFSPDRKILASGTGWAASDIRLWDVAAGQEIGQLTGHTAWVGSLVFLPDGMKLASASADQTIRLWDVASRTCTDVLRGHRLEVWRLALLPDEKTLVSGCKDGTVCFWDTSVSHPRRESIKLPEKVSVWRFAPDSQSVLTLNNQGQLSRWSGSDFQQKEVILETGTNGSRSLISQDGRFLAACSADGILRVWDVPKRALSHQLNTDTAEVAYPLNFLADGSKLLTGPWPNSSAIGKMHEWDLATGVEIQSWQVPEYSVADVSPDERYCLSESNGDRLVRNLADKSSTSSQQDTLEVAQVCYSPDGKLVAFASDLGYARVFDAANWQSVATLGGYLLGVHDVAFSSDTQRLLTCSDRKEALKLWATDSWQNVLTLEANDVSKLMGGGAAFSPDGNVIGWLSSAGDLCFWYAPSWADIAAAEAKQKAISPQP